MPASASAWRPPMAMSSFSETKPSISGPNADTQLFILL